VISKDNKAVILAGSGGCGKTSTITEMLQTEGWKYISEDFAIISEKGVVYSFPRKMAIYASDLRFGNKILRNAIKKNLTPFERTRWNLLNKMGKDPLYHLRPGQVLGADKLANSAKIDKVFFLTRTTKANKTERQEISYDQLINRICNFSFREIKEFFEILFNVWADGDDDCTKYYPTFAKWNDSTGDHMKHKHLLSIERKVLAAMQGISVVPSLVDIPGFVVMKYFHNYCTFRKYILYTDDSRSEKLRLIKLLISEWKSFVTALNSKELHIQFKQIDYLPQLEKKMFDAMVSKPIDAKLYKVQRTINRIYRKLIVLYMEKHFILHQDGYNRILVHGDFHLNIF